MYKYKLPVLEKIGFGAGDMAVNVVISSMMLIITFFYTDIFGIKPEDLAMLFIVVRLNDAVTDPLMGMITDKFTSRSAHLMAITTLSWFTPTRPTFLSL